MIHKKCKNNDYEFYHYQITRLMRAGFDFYSSKSKPTQKRAYQYIIKTFMTAVLKDIDGNIVSVEIKDDLAPSFCQFRYFLKKEKLFREEAKLKLRASTYRI